ncbi:type VII secretion integral membrane protein EccD [Mycolicibacterium sp. 3033]|nr:type VII secretion integral membrane protein EccD [Mycolicibacterium aurantiacum]
MTVHAAGPRGWSQADLMLPTGCPLGSMMPEIVDAVVGPAEPGGPSSASPPLGWYASRLAGQRLDPSLTLHESGIADGELILLSTTEPPTPQRVPGDGCAAVLTAADGSTTGWSRAGSWVGLTGCLAAAATLAWSGAQTPAPGPLWVAAVLALSSSAAALAVRRTAHAATTPAGLAAVAFAAAAGFLAVPDPPAPAALLLTASAALVMSTSMARSACRDSVALGAVVTAAAGVVAVAAVCTLSSPRIAVAGSLLAVTAVVVLSVAPKLAITVAGIGPSHSVVDEKRSADAHRLLTSVVTGSAGTAALAVALVALDAARSPEATLPVRLAAVLLAVDIGLVLSLRQRVHSDGRRRIALGFAAMAALATALAGAAVTAPAQAYWIAGVTGAAGLAVIGVRRGDEIANPVLRQSVNVLDYLSAAAVVPLAAWAGGLYDVARNLGLP